MRTLLPAATLILALTALSACGGEDDPPRSGPGTDLPSEAATDEVVPAPSETPTEETPTEAASVAPGMDPVETVEAWSLAYSVPDAAAACALQTDRFTEVDLAQAAEQDLVEPDATCEEGVQVGHDFGISYGIAMEEGRAESISESDDRATVELTYPGSDPQTYELVRDDGVWLIDATVED